MTDSSSRDLHPTSGGRFVAHRSRIDPLEYAVSVYLPEGRRLDTQLCWREGQAVLDPGLDDEWAEAETLKLARVLRRTSRASVTRWRAR